MTDDMRAPLVTSDDSEREGEIPRPAMPLKTPDNIMRRLSDPHPKNSQYNNLEANDTSSDAIADDVTTLPTDETNSRYQLYNVNYYPRAIDDWRRSPVDVSPYSELWSSEDCFLDHSFFFNYVHEHRWHFLPWAIIFYCHFGVICIFLFAAVMTSKNYVGRWPINSTLVLFSFFLSFVFVFINIIQLFHFPKFYLKNGIWLGIVFIIAAVAIGILCGIRGQTSFALLMSILSLFYYFFSKNGISFSQVVVENIKSLFFKNFLFGIFYIIIFSLISIIYSYCAYYAADSSWYGIAYFFILVFYWWTSWCFGNIVYVVSAQLTAVSYFLDNTPSSPSNQLSKALSRAFSTNLGDSALTATLLPFIEWVRVIARKTPHYLHEELKVINETFANVIVKIYTPIFNLAVKLAQWIDEKLNYLDRRGLIYTAMFSIEVTEGSRRDAENSSKNFTNLLHESCVIDRVFAFKALNAATIAGFLNYGFANKMTRMYQFRYLGAGYGFFLCFGIFHLIRSHIRSIYETLFVCFVEHPTRMSEYNPDLATTLREEYERQVSDMMSLS